MCSLCATTARPLASDAGWYAVGNVCLGLSVILIDITANTKELILSRWDNSHAGAKNPITTAGLSVLPPPPILGAGGRASSRHVRSSLEALRSGLTAASPL
jgi:hypothetical protein